MNWLIVVVVLQSIAIILEVQLHRRLNRKTEESLVKVDESMSLLKIIKEWAYSAKSHSSDAKETLREVKESVKKSGSDEVLLKEVKTIPDKVVEKIAETDSGKQPVSKPG